MKTKNGRNYVKSRSRIHLTPADRVAIACELIEEPMKEIAARAEISPTVLSDIIHGRRKIGRDIGIRLSKTLNLPLHRLLGAENPNEEHVHNILKKMRRHIRSADSIGEETGKILLKDIEELDSEIRPSA